MKTISSEHIGQLLRADDRQKVKGDNCFDFLRYLFAISLIIAHFCTLTETEQFWFISGGMRVKAFFVITGFLVSFSFLSRNGELKTYSIKRIVRIIPAYLCAIIFCFFVGVLMSTLPTSDFFSIRQTWKYLGANICMLNWLQPALPGVFTNNFMTAVNGSLWSMKLEVLFYILVPGLFYLIVRWSRKVVIPLLVTIIIVINGISSMPGQAQYATYFFVGVIALLVFSQFYRYMWLILFSAVGIALLNHCLNFEWVQRLYPAIEPFVFSAILLSIAYTMTFLKGFRRCANITYGLYLYHFPVIQVLIDLGLAKYNLWLCFWVALAITWGLANVSWFVIEKPLMQKYK